MSTQILYISNINPPDPEEVQRLFDIHQNDQDVMLVKRYDQELPGGFDIVKVDDTAENVLKRDKDAREGLDHRSLKVIAQQAKVKRAGAWATMDRSITHGEKELKDRIAEGNLK